MPGQDLLMDLAELRSKSGQKAKALSVYDYLMTVPDDAKNSSGVTKSMIGYHRGVLLKDLGRIDDARRSFELSKRLGPDTVWGRLSSSAQKEIKPISDAGSR
jgi:hypothetical protein